MTPSHQQMVWTDFGGVLTPSVSDSFAAFAQAVGVEPGRLMNGMRDVSHRYGTTDVLEPLDTALVDEDEWARQLSAVLGTPIAGDALSGPWFRDRPVDRDWLGVLERLPASGIRVGLVTNMPPSWACEWRRMVDPGLFEKVVISSAVGARKPDREIFRIAAATAEVRSAQCILVDDLDANCDGAEAAGWRAVRYRTAQQATQDLGSLLGVRL